MFRITSTFLYIGEVALLVGACGTTDPTETAYMEATIDGVMWQAEGTGCDYDTSAQMLDVQGSRAVTPDTMRAIFLKAWPILGPETVTLGGHPAYALIWDYTGYGNAHLGYTTTNTLTGTWTISELDFERRRCSGTFSFVAEAYSPKGGAFTPDTINVTNGAWAAELSVY